MPELFHRIFSSGPYIPHGHCYLWQPSLVWLHLASDVAIALAYYSIPIWLIYFVHKRQDIPFKWIFWLFGAFIVACGTTHAISVWTLWHPTYWLSGLIKATTAIVSGFTALELIPLLPLALALPSPTQLRETNQALQQEIQAHEQAEAEIRRLNAELEERVAIRTAELQQSNDQLAQEILRRQETERVLRESQERLTRVFETIPNGITILNCDGEIIDANRSAETILGLKHSHLTQRRYDAEIWQITTLNGDPFPPSELPFVRVMESGKPVYNIEHAIAREDGHTVLLSINAAPLLDANQTITGLVASLHDITERRSAEQALVQQSEILQTIFDHVPAMIAFFDPEGRLQWVNREWETIVGWKFVEIQDRDILSELYPDPQYRQQVLDFIESANRSWADFRISLPNGQTIETSWSNVKLSNGSNIGIGVDVSDRKRTEKELQQLNETLEAQVVQRTAELQTVFDALPDYIRIVERDSMRLSFCNDLLAQAIGFENRHQLQGKTIDQCFSAENAAILKRQNQQVFESGEPLHLQEKLELPTGTLHVDTFKIPLRTSDGEIYALLGASRDITDLVEARQALAERNSQLSALLNNAPDVISRFNGNLQYNYVNPAVEKVTGIPTAHFTGKTHEDLEVPLEVCSLWNASLRQVFATGQGTEIESPFLNTTRIYQSRLVPEFHPSGSIEHVLVVSRDITEKRQAEESINQLNTDLRASNLRLEATNKELESFSYSVSHDLRAPLRHISGFVQLLSKRLDQQGLLQDTKLSHYLNVIHTSSHKMGLLIDGLLTLSRLGRRQLELSSVEIRPLVDTAIARSQSNSDQPEFILNHLPTVVGDPSLLQQLFSNLISNAVKFSRNSVPSRIEVGTLEDGTIYVKDNGVGFQMEYADQLFGAFQRLHSDQDFEGTGIGLAIVQRIVHRHGGTIWAESQPNCGATFYIRFNQPATDCDLATLRGELY